MHETFSNVPTLLEGAGQNSPAFVGFLGTIVPAELVGILAAYTAAWMNGVFMDKIKRPLLEGEGLNRFPEVSIVKKGKF
jgi:hypothetical protein